MAKVYVSSTLADLGLEREAVLKWLVAAGHQPVHSYRPDSDSVRDSCLEDIDGCDLYVLLLGYRYGHQPTQDNPESLSITHLEFRRAGDRGIPRVALLRKFLPDVTKSDLFQPDASARVQAFHKEVQEAVRAAEFRDMASLIQELSTGVQTALAKRRTRVQPVAASAGAAPQASNRQQVWPDFVPTQDTPLIGRERLIEEVKVAMRTGKRTLAFVKLPGVGKTAVAKALLSDEDLRSRFDGALWAHVGRKPDVRKQLRDWAKALEAFGEPRIDFRRLGNKLSSWTSAVAKLIANRSMLIVLDDVWNAAEEKALLVGGQKSIHLVTTRQVATAKDFAGPNYLVVPQLDTEQGVELLRAMAPRAVELEPAKAAELVEAVGGLPKALLLMGYLLNREDSSGERIRKALDKLHDTKRLLEVKQQWLANPVLGDDDDSDNGLTLASAIEVSYDALGDAPRDAGDLRKALEDLSILRPDPARFSARQAQLITGAIPEALYALYDAGLIESAGDRRTGDQPGVELYTMHRTIAEHMRTKLSPERASALHQRAADYYRQELERIEEKYQASELGYGAWYRYENAEWQECKDSWLYHVAKSGDEQQAAMAFLRTWFEGFWWWGVFLEFGFCKQLLREWQQRKLTSEGKVGVVTLKELMKLYPKETERGPDRTSQWQRVQALLTELRAQTGLDGDPALLSDDNARQVRALTSILLAEAHRFGRRDWQAADALYSDALTIFRQNGDDWDTAWTLYHRADLHHQSGRSEQVAQACDEALKLGEQENDPEILALVHRLLADLARDSGQLEAAARHYHAALRHAYRFQIEPEEAPDPYTIGFYRQMAELVCSRLIDIYSSAPNRGSYLLGVLHDTWHRSGSSAAVRAQQRAAVLEAIEAGDVVLLGSRLLPSPLSPGQLESQGSDYAATVRSTLDALPEQPDR